MRYITALNASFAIALLLMAASGRLRGQNAVGEMEKAYVNALPDGPGKAEMVRVCGGCHGIDEIGVVALSKRRMAGKDRRDVPKWSGWNGSGS